MDVDMDFRTTPNKLQCLNLIKKKTRINCYMYIYILYIYIYIYIYIYTHKLF